MKGSPMETKVITNASAEVVHPQEMESFSVPAAEVIDPQETGESSITIVKPTNVFYGK
jgi:hypothetical protein